MNTPLLEVTNLKVTFPMRSGAVHAIENVSFTLAEGERIGIVGESGAGKSVTAFALINLVSKPGYISGGSVRLKGVDLTKLDNSGIRAVRGSRIGMIFQDPMVTLNPVLTVGTQMVETLLAHGAMSRAQARRKSIESLRAVQIPSPEKRLDQYPHELSGGMRQRVVIAVALLGDPEIIIADEPTTALDVTIQAEILELLLNLCREFRVGLILITHDLAVVSQVTERMIVMYAGSIVEEGPTAALIERPVHPYTHGLIQALPQRTEPGQRLRQIPGVMPSLQDISAACQFHPRCEFAEAICREVRPPLEALAGRQVACHFARRFVSGEAD